MVLSGGGYARFRSQFRRLIGPAQGVVEINDQASLRGGT